MFSEGSETHLDILLGRYTNPHQMENDLKVDGIVFSIIISVKESNSVQEIVNAEAVEALQIRLCKQTVSKQNLGMATTSGKLEEKIEDTLTAIYYWHLLILLHKCPFLTKIQNRISKKTIVLLSCRKIVKTQFLGVVEFPSIFLIQFFKLVESLSIF